MVFIVSGNVNEEAKDEPISNDVEANLEVLLPHRKLSSTWLLPASPRVRKSTRRSGSSTFCIIVPWMLFCLCLFLLSCVSTWGWKQHALAQDLLTIMAAEKNTITPLDTPVPEHSVAAPHPYGNDGLVPEQPPRIEEIVINEEEDITVIEENVIEENIIVVQNPEQPQAVSNDPLANDAGLFALPEQLFPIVSLDDPTGVPYDDEIGMENSAAPAGHKDVDQLPKDVDKVGISRDELPVG